MKFLQMFSAPKSPKIETGSAKNVHPNFKMTDDGFWYQNRYFYPYENSPICDMKVSFKFDDSHLLDDCPFVAKIGMNESDGPKYFGLAYGNRDTREKVIEWAKRFPAAQILDGLDYNGEVTEKTIRTNIAP